MPAGFFMVDTTFCVLLALNKVVHKLHGMNHTLIVLFLAAQVSCV